MPLRADKLERVSGRYQYLLNVLWGWVGAATLILNGAIMAPYLIRNLGTEQNGIWVLALSMIEFFWMIDLGVRPATIKLSAEYHALEKWSDLNSVLNTAVLYSGVIGLLILSAVTFNTARIAQFYHIAHPSFPLLIQMVSLSWAFGLVFNVFEAGLEGFQRFDITNRIFILFTLARSMTLIAMVHFGYGLTGMAIGLLVTQFMMYAAFYVSLRRIFSELRVSPRLASRAAGREIWLYAKQVVSAMLSARLLSSAIPSLITLFLRPGSLTYYNSTQRVLDYAGEGIGRIGIITGPRASDWMARGLRPQLVRLGEYGNRYCLCLWLIFATFLAVYGRPLFIVWVNPEFADNSTLLLQIFLFGYTLWLGQFVSASILMGIGRYSEYSASLMIEAILTVASFAVLLPRYGLAAAVAAFSIMISLNRCVNLSRIFTKEFQIPQIPFLWRVYRTPMTLGVLDMAGLYIIRHSWIPGRSWAELIAVGVVNTLVFGAAAFWLVLEPDHRELMLRKIAERFRAYAQPRQT